VTALVAAGAVLALPTGNAGATGGGIGTGEPTSPNPTTPGSKAKLRKNGQAVAPANAPRRVKRAIAAANDIAGKPYKYGGGHSRWKDSGYDCSGAVSYAIGKPGAKLLDAPVPSGTLASWGKRGKGKWITVYANGGHTYVMIAGLRFESHGEGDGPDWSRENADPAGYKVRHTGRF
jgi:cell wall-associated NlpC family hydrolase